MDKMKKVKKKRKMAKNLTLPHWDSNPRFLNKTFPPKIWILREIRSIELTVLEKISTLHWKPLYVNWRLYFWFKAGPSEILWAFKNAKSNIWWKFQTSMSGLVYNLPFLMMSLLKWYLRNSDLPKMSKNLGLVLWSP